MIEPSTAAKCTGGALVLGGGGTGAYYAGKVYINQRLENLDVKDYIEETETLVPKVEYVDNLKDDDDYLKKLGNAYLNYNQIYVSSNNEGYVSEIAGVISGFSIEEQDRDKKLGKKIRDWCRKSIEDNKKEDREKVKRWCVKRPINSEKVRETSEGKSLKSRKEDFKDGDYGTLSGKLTELGLIQETGWLGSYKTDENGKGGVCRWCSVKADDLYYDYKNEVFELFKSLCF